MPYILIIFLKEIIKKFFSGSFGDYSLYSFNIMKNISVFWWGVSTNDKKFIEFAKLKFQIMTASKKCTFETNYNLFNIKNTVYWNSSQNIYQNFISSS